MTKKKDSSVATIDSGVTKSKRKVPLQALQLGGEELIGGEGERFVTFELLEPVAGAAAGDQRQWSMVAHTGQMMSRWFGKLILDMDGASYRQKMALLNDHITSERLGFSESVKRTDKGIEARGKLLDNELANAFLKDSKAGFPFQASLRADPSIVEEVQAGAKANVNGREVTGPVTIFRKFDISELTATVLGADSNTATEAFAGTSPRDVEVEVHEVLNMTVKTTEPEAPKVPPGPTEADIQKAQALAAETERKRVTRIMAAADTTQEKLAKELIANGTAFEEAIEQLHTDLRKRMSVKLGEAISGPGTESAGAGNRESESLKASFAGLDPASHKKEYLDARVRDEFHSESAYLAFRRHNPRPFQPVESLLDWDRNVVKLGLGTTSSSPLSMRGIRGDYYDLLDQKQGLSWVNAVASRYQTDQPQEEYDWLGHAPVMIPWENDRSFQDLRGDKLVIVNKDYESTISFRGKDFRRDKSQQMRARVDELATAVALLPEELITGLLVANATAYDGIALFHASSHVIGDSGIIKNLLGTGDGLAGAAAPTASQMATNILLAIQQLMGFKNDRGKPMNAQARKFLVHIPINMFASTVAALANEFVAASTNNTLKALISRGLQIDYAVNPLLTATNEFYVHRTDASVGSFIYQEEVDETADWDFSSERYKNTGKVAFGVSASAGAGPGRFEYVIKGATS